MEGGKCAGCHNALVHKQYVVCLGCDLRYDFPCTNLSPKRYRRMNEDNKRSWRCLNCTSKIPKTDNTNTPVRSEIHPKKLLRDDSDCDDLAENVNNVTQRKTPAVPAASEKFITEDSLGAFFENNMKKTKVLFECSLQGLTTQLNTLNTQYAGFQESLSFVCSQYEDLKKEVIDLKKLLGATSLELKNVKEDNKRLHESVAILTNKIQWLEGENSRQQQWLRLQNLEVVGIPETKDEVLTDIALKLSSHVGVPIQNTDIEFAHRVQPRKPTSTTQSRPIVIKFKQRIIKDRILASSRKFRNMSAENIGIGNASNKIYINEHLTKDNKLLLNSCKQKARECGFKYIWTKNCRVFVRKDDATPPIPINSVSDLLKIS